MPLSLSFPLIDAQACDVDGMKKAELNCEGSAASGLSTAHIRRVIFGYLVIFKKAVVAKIF